MLPLCAGCWSGAVVRVRCGVGIPATWKEERLVLGFRADIAAAGIVISESRRLRCCFRRMTFNGGLILSS
jgi:hypothetical protein